MRSLLRELLLTLLTLNGGDSVSRSADNSAPENLRFEIVVSDFHILFRWLRVEAGGPLFEAIISSTLGSVRRHPNGNDLRFGFTNAECS